MDALEAIHTRRSVRKYQASPVSEELIQQLIAAAAMAPSARNGQPWQFVVIDDRKLLDEIPKSCPHAAMVAHAPLAILICADPSLEKSPGYWPQDCAAAAENMLLAAEMVAQASLTRIESRGAHYRQDYPYEDDNWRRSLLIRNDDGKICIEKTAGFA